MKTFDDLIKDQKMSRADLAAKSRCSQSLVDKACVGNMPSDRMIFVWSVVTGKSESLIRRRIENSGNGEA